MLTNQYDNNVASQAACCGLCESGNIPATFKAYAMSPKKKDPMLPTQALFLNREIGILEFNRRVLAQAEDADTPGMLERLKFLCIVSSNLDEFFEIRVAELKETIRVNLSGAGPDGMSPREVFATVNRIAHELVERQYRLLNEKNPARTGQGRRAFPAPQRSQRSAAARGYAITFSTK